jgi:predicted kinase
MTSLRRRPLPANPPSLYFLCGLPFAGKSTLARALAALTGARHVALDAINTERGLGLDGAPITSEQWDETYTEAYRRIEEALAAGDSVVYDETCFLRAQRDRVRAIAARTSAHAQLIWVTTPEEVARERLQANRQTGARFDVRDDNFAQVVTRFEPPTPDERALRYDGAGPPQEWLARMGLAGVS